MRSVIYTGLDLWIVSLVNVLSFGPPDDASLAAVFRPLGRGEGLTLYLEGLGRVYVG